MYIYVLTGLLILCDGIMFINGLKLLLIAQCMKNCTILAKFNHYLEKFRIYTFFKMICPWIHIHVHVSLKNLLQFFFFGSLERTSTLSLFIAIYAQMFNFCSLMLQQPRSSFLLIWSLVKYMHVYKQLKKEFYNHIIVHSYRRIYPKHF